MATRDKIKQWFQAGARPSASHFAAWIDSFFHKDDKIPYASVAGLDDALADKVSKADLTGALTKYLPVRVIDLGMLGNLSSLMISFDETDVSEAMDILTAHNSGKCICMIQFSYNGSFCRCPLSSFIDDKEYPTLYFIFNGGIVYIQIWKNLDLAEITWDECSWSRC